MDLRTLSKESFIVAPRDLAPGLFDLTMSHCRSAGFTPRITQHARQMQTVIGLVSCGMGFALVPSSVRNLKRPGVRYRRLLKKGAPIKLGVLRLAHSDSPLRERFIDTLRAAARAKDT
jgi:DNA-binding transcriptional LysR family regulator